MLDPEPCTTLAALAAAQAAMDRRLVALVEALGPADLDRIVEVHRTGRVQREAMHRLLLHLFQHQVHHRGQAHAMLERDLGAATAARRVLLGRRGAPAGGGVRAARLDRGPGLAGQPPRPRCADPLTPSRPPSEPRETATL